MNVVYVMVMGIQRVRVIVWEHLLLNIMIAQEFALTIKMETCSVMNLIHAQQFH